MADVPGPGELFGLESLDPIHEIDSSITQLQYDLSIIPRFDPRRLQPLFDLAEERHSRYDLLSQSEDLDKEIDHLTELILLSTHSRLQRRPMILTALFLLADALFLRSKPEDAIFATKYLSYLRDQPHEVPTIPRYQVTALLVEALVLQCKLEVGNTMQNIREMAVLSLELLKTPDVDAIHFIVLIHAVVRAKILPDFLDQPLDELIEFSRAAMKHRPDLLDGHMICARSLVCRYSMTCVNDDYEEAVSILDKIIADSSSWNSQDQFLTKARAHAIVLVTGLATLRSAAYQTPENAEEAIYRMRTCASSPSVKEHYLSPSLLSDPEAAAKIRFRHFGLIEGVEESSGTSWADASSQTPIDTMKDLRFGIRNTDHMTEIDEAIEKGRSIALASDPTDPSFLNLFGDLLYEAFWRTNKIEYLNESISIFRQVFESPRLHGDRFLNYPYLPRSLLLRSDRFPGYRTQDMDEALELLSQFVSRSHASVPNRFRHARGVPVPSARRAYGAGRHKHG